MEQIEEKIKRKKLRKIGMILYKESCDIEECLNTLQKSYVVQKYAYIEHNKDVDENGELKKSHYHLYLYFPKQQDVAPIMKIFNVNHIEAIQDEDATIRYFIHKNNPEKYQYEIDDIKTNFDIRKCFTIGKDENEEQEVMDLLKILNYIESDKYTNMNDLLKWVLGEKIYCNLRWCSTCNRFV